MRKTIIFGIVLMLSLNLILGACAPVSPNSDGAEETPVTLRIAVLPIIDTIPLFVARDEGVFDELGVDVKFIPVSSAPELSQMVASGQADGMVTDGLTVAFFNKEEIQLQIVRYAQTPSEDRGHFFILAAKDSGITNPEDLKNIEIGISEGTIIEYVTDRLLEKEGFSADEIATIAVPKIPDRMALLGSGEIQVAVLPDPLASLAVLQGATIVLDDSQSSEYGASVYAFSKEIIDEHPEAIGAFVEAIDIAVGLLAENPQEYTALLVENKLIPQPLIESYVIPPFPYGIYSEAEWEDTLFWAQEKDLLSVNIPYEETVNASFLP